jgi:hypothetical protein
MVMRHSALNHIICIWYGSDSDTRSASSLKAREHAMNTQPVPVTSNAAAVVDMGGIADLKFIPSGPLWVVATAAASPRGGGGGGGGGGAGVRPPAGEEDDTRASAGVLVHQYLLADTK